MPIFVPPDPNTEGLTWMPIDTRRTDRRELTLVVYGPDSNEEALIRVRLDKVMCRTSRYTQLVWAYGSAVIDGALRAYCSEPQTEWLTVQHAPTTGR